ncbi:hypothetical protein S83_004567 [Arachis hypogaea]
MKTQMMLYYMTMEDLNFIVCGIYILLFLQTDTASVLLKVIGYIRFLQSQIEVIMFLQSKIKISICKELCWAYSLRYNQLMLPNSQTHVIFLINRTTCLVFAVAIKSEIKILQVSLKLILMSIAKYSKIKILLRYAP